MKKRIIWFLAIVLAFSMFTGCSNNESSSSGKENDTSASESEIDSNVDIDISILSSTMMYAEIDNISTNAEKYKGQTIKMRGTYRVLSATMNDNPYTFVVVYDETQCCEAGIEFRVTGDYVFPDDYPSEDTEIEVTGIYKSHDDFDLPYYYIETDKIEIVG